MTGGPASLGPAPVCAGLSRRPRCSPARPPGCCSRSTWPAAPGSSRCCGRDSPTSPVATVTASVVFALYAVPFVVLLRTIDYLERERRACRPWPPCGAAWSRPRRRSWGRRRAEPHGQAGFSGPGRAVGPGGERGGRRGAGQGGRGGLHRAGRTRPHQRHGRRLRLRRPGRPGLPDGGERRLRPERGGVRRRQRRRETGHRDAPGPGFLGGLWSHTLFTGLAAGVAFALVRRGPSGRRAGRGGGRPVRRGRRLPPVVECARALRRRPGTVRRDGDAPGEGHPGATRGHRAGGRGRAARGGVLRRPAGGRGRPPDRHPGRDRDARVTAAALGGPSARAGPL